MNCILKSCAHAKLNRCESLGECGAAHALNLSRQRDGYLVIARDNPTIEALRKSGLVTTKYAGDGCLVVRATAAKSQGKAA